MRTQRPGTFRKGHKKLGGRQKGTPNRYNSNLIDSLLQAAEQVGSDGKGKNGIDGYFRKLAGKNVGYFVSLLRPAVHKQMPATEPEREIVVYATEQDFRQALLDLGVHPTLLPPPRDLDEKPPVNGKLAPPKPPPGWEWILRKKSGSVELTEQQADDANEEGEASPEPVDPDDEPKGTPMNPVPGWKWKYHHESRAYYPVRYNVETMLDINPDRHKPTI